MTNLKKRIKVTIERTNTGFSAYAIDYNVGTTGKNITELMSNIIEALNLYLEERKKFVTEKNIELKVDFKQFFKYYRIINSKYLAERIGMNPTLLSQYVQGHKTPSEIQTSKIIHGIKQVGKELTELNF